MNILRKHRALNWTLVDQAMISGVNFLTGVLLARYLGIEAFGVFTLAWIMVLFINNLQMATISQPMMSVGPKLAEHDAPTYYGSILIHQIIYSIASTILLLILLSTASQFAPQWEISSIIWPLTWVAVSFQAQDFIRRYLFSRTRSSSAFLNDAVSYLGQVAALIWLISHSSLSIRSALMGIAATSTIAIAVGVIQFGKVQITRSSFTQTTIRHWHFSKWLTASTTLQWFTQNLFYITAGSILGTASVGAMKAAQNIVGVTPVLLLALDNLVPLRAAKHFHANGISQLNQYLKRVSALSVVPFAAPLVLAFVLPEFWLTLVFGPEYKDYAFVLQWYAGIYLFLLPQYVLTHGFRAIEKTYPIFVVLLSTTIISAIIAIPAAQYLGLKGILIGIAIQMLVSVTMLSFAYLRQTARQKRDALRSASQTSD